MFSLYMGADIEFFTTILGKVVPANEVLGNNTDKSINKDGIQLEINPKPSSCRESICHNIKYLFSRLNDRNININNASVVNIKKSTFDEINDDDKQMGCLPDINIYTMKENRIPGDYRTLRTRTAGGHIHISSGHEEIVLYLGTNRTTISLDYNDIDIHSFPKNGKMKIKDHKIVKDLVIKALCNVSNLTYQYILPELPINIYTKRNAGWPRQEEKDEYKLKIQKLTDKYIDDIEFEFILFPATQALLRPEVTIPILDLFVGIPSILLDNPKKQCLRRKYYGMAGSFRYTNYGLEYRVLSNFWSFSSIYTSLMFGLTREAVRYAYLIINNKPVVKELKEYLDVNREKIIYAINNADQGLAKEILNEFLFSQYLDTKVGWKKNHDGVPLGGEGQQIVFKNLVMNEKNIGNKKAQKFNGFYNYYSSKYTSLDKEKVKKQWLE